ncbi:hypothetical protein J6590_058713 [Homalodisca vitripennis]|nr:hypothetical protein J6590_058713 [Homalodisca vitripennis]
MIQRVAPPPATIIRSRYFRLSSATNRFRLSICLTGSASAIYYIPPHMLTYDTKYNFTLKVWTNLYDKYKYSSVTELSKFTNVEIEVSGENEMVPYDIDIIL